MLSVGRFVVAPVVVDAAAKGKQREDEKEAPLVGVDAHVELIDYCAQITQTQRFINNEKTALETTFEFELPKGCAVSSFSADVGDRHLTGRVQEKHKAEERYDDALAAGHSAVLLEAKEEDPNTFVVQLGNLAPGKEAFVTVTYELLATMTDDKIVLTLDGSDATNVIFADPSTVKAADDGRMGPGFHFSVHVATQSPLKSVSSPSHPIVVELGEDGARVSLAEGADWRENKSFVLEAAVADRHQPSVRIQKGKDEQMAMVSFYPRIDTRQTKCEMIFVVDRSGSMAGSAMECAKSTLQFFLRSLPADAYFNIISFGDTFERFSHQSVPFNDDTLKAATAHVSRLKANLGGTNIYDPLNSIYSQSVKPGFPRQIFILTDGEVRDKERCIDLVRGNVNTTRLFAFGIGNAVDRDLVHGMARAGEGRSSIVRDISSIRGSVMKQIEYAVQPGLTDIHITWKDDATGNPLPGSIVRQTPANLPPVFRGTRLVSFALLPENCGSCKVVLTGSFGDSQFTSEVAVNPSSAENIPGDQIVKLGIRSLIEDIQNGCGGFPSERRDEIQRAITDLSVKYDVMSKYTAFVAIGSGGETLETSMVTRRVSRRSEASQSLAPIGINASDQNMNELRALLDSMDEDERRKMELDLGIYRGYGFEAPSEFSMMAPPAPSAPVAPAFYASRGGTRELEHVCGLNPKRRTAEGFFSQRKEDRHVLEKQKKKGAKRFGSRRKEARYAREEQDEAGMMFDDLKIFSGPNMIDHCCSLVGSDSGAPLFPDFSQAEELEEECEECCAAHMDDCFSSVGLASHAPFIPDFSQPEASVDRTKSLDNVILQQKASGCFEAFALELLDIPESAKNARPTKLPDGMNKYLADDIWITLLVVIGLHDKYGDKKSEWNFLAVKSENWVKDNLGAAYDEWKAAAVAAYNHFHA